MANKQVRQLANEIGAPTAELMSVLGVNSGSAMVDEDQSRAKWQQHKQGGNTRAQQSQSQQSPQQPAAPGMLGEVAGEFRQHILTQGAMLAIQGKQQLRQDVSMCWNASEEEVRGLLNQSGVTSPDSVDGTFDFFKRSEGHSSLDEMMTAIGASNSVKQLMGAKPSTSQPEAEVTSQNNSTEVLETALE